MSQLTRKSIVQAVVLTAATAVSGYALFKFYTARKGKSSCCGGCPSKVAPSKPHVVFVLGGPGAGKGTQCSHIVNDFGFVHLSAGDLLRDEQKKGGETGNMIKKLIAEGQIVPVAVTLGLLKDAMIENQKQSKNRFLIDGFPRNYDNLQGWNEAMSDFAQVDFCLFLDCPEKVMEKRLLKRGETSGRADDNAESIRKRFATYVESTKPVIETFKQQNKLKHVLADKTVEEVREEVRKIFSSVNWN